MTCVPSPMLNVFLSDEDSPNLGYQVSLSHSTHVSVCHKVVQYYVFTLILLGFFHGTPLPMGGDVPAVEVSSRAVGRHARYRALAQYLPWLPYADVRCRVC